MSEPEQCIICLDSLPLPRSSGSDLQQGAAGAGGPPPVQHDQVPPPPPPPPAAAAATGSTTTDSDHDLNIVAALDGCEHIIHDSCIRSWAQKTNTCPICRNLFHTVRVFNGVDGKLLCSVSTSATVQQLTVLPSTGTEISKYKVEDKKQVAEFDIQAWLGENVEEEPEQNHPCPICNSGEREDVLLLCDSCDAAYHTDCIGLEGIPDGDWYCMECRHLFQLTDEPNNSAEQGPRPNRPQRANRPHPRDVRGYHVRTRARLRRARRQARNDEWQGAWGQFVGRFYDLSDVDLDNFDEEDEEMEQFRRFQQLDRAELQRWQQRMNIAQRLGARDVFRNNIPPQINEHLQPAAPIVEETKDEKRAWGALEVAREAEGGPSNSASTRKRKARSVTASPAEPIPEPERKLKRPRTRRMTTQPTVASSSTAPPAAAGPSEPNGEAISPRDGAPLVSSLLKELEPNAPSEDETGLALANGRRANGASSPVLSPSPSSPSSPRAMSMTPPPLPLNGRPSSPLSLSTHIEPRYPPANYSPTRNGHGSGSGSGSDGSDSESNAKRKERRRVEVRQPRPRRVLPIHTRVEENSPTRASMTQEEKKNINDIVKTALRPHWRAQKLSSEQYAIINRDVSRRLYEEVRDPVSLDEDMRRTWEKRASDEVDQAVAGLSSA